MDKVITFFNFKGGVGKTTFAYNLAKILECPIFEEAEDCLSHFFSQENNGLEVYEFDVLDENIKKLQSGIYDLNINNPKKIRYILERSDYIIIPTYLDFKDLIKTLASIKFSYRCNQKSKIIVLFNRLNTTNKSAEIPFTMQAQKFLLSGHKIEVEFLYARNSRSWYEGTMNGIYFLDFIKKDYFAVKDIKNYFTDTKLIEICYQYLYYYNPIYKKKRPDQRSDYEKNFILLVSDDEQLYDYLVEICFDAICDEFLCNTKIAHSPKTLKKYILERDNNNKGTAHSSREKAIYAALQQLINIKELRSRKKVIKDIKYLLIAVDEYNLDSSTMEEIYV